jgi:hypothetical protein
VGTHLSKQPWMIDPEAVFCAPPGSDAGTKPHLNAVLPPNDPDAATDFTYMTTDASLNGEDYLVAVVPA